MQPHKCTTVSRGDVFSHIVHVGFDAKADGSELHGAGNPEEPRVLFEEKHDARAADIECNDFI